MMESFFQKSLRGVYQDGIDSYDLLPAQIKALHDVQQGLTAQGRADIVRGPSIWAKMAAKFLGFPQAGRNIPVTITFTRTKTGETLMRDFGGQGFETRFYPFPKPGHYLERLGAVWSLIECICTAQGVDVHLRKIWLWKAVPLPLWLGPRIQAYERVKDGKYHFDVTIGLPIIGQVIHYQGRLEVVNKW